MVEFDVILRVGGDGTSTTRSLRDSLRCSRSVSTADTSVDLGFFSGGKAVLNLPMLETWANQPVALPQGHLTTHVLIHSPSPRLRSRPSHT